MPIIQDKQAEEEKNEENAELGQIGKKGATQWGALASGIAGGSSGLQPVTIGRKSDYNLIFLKLSEAHTIAEFIDDGIKIRDFI